MESAFRPSAQTGEGRDSIDPFADAINVAKKYLCRAHCSTLIGARKVCEETRTNRESRRLKCNVPTALLLVRFDAALCALIPASIDLECQA